MFGAVFLFIGFISLEDGDEVSRDKGKAYLAVGGVLAGVAATLGVAG
jgi:hypothetical protein